MTNDDRTLTAICHACLWLALMDLALTVIGQVYLR